MTSFVEGTVREEPHGLDTSILDRVADHTTTPAPAGAAIPIQRKLSLPDLITKVGKKVSRAGFDGQTARGGAEQVDGGTLNDGDQDDDTKFVVEDIKSFNDVSQ
ncbi:hypothetical protein Tco_0289144, partial [Tanacetum coccineum]